jgi:predicted ATPase
MEAKQQYLQLQSQAQHQLSQLEVWLGRMIWVRTLLFLTGTAAFVVGYIGKIATGWTVPIGWFCCFAFLVAIVVNEHLRLRSLAGANELDLLRRLLARVDRNWPSLPSQKFLPEIPVPDYADDLDMSGDSGLLTLVSLAGTQPGRLTLQRWLTQAPDWPEVQKRQKAVRTLIPERDLRIQIIRNISGAGFGAKKPYGLIQWAQSPNWLAQHPVAKWLSYLGPAVLVTGAALLLLGLQSNNITWTKTGYVSLAIGVAMNILITLLWGGWIQDIFHRVSGEHHATWQFSQVFTLLKQLPSDEGILQQAKQTCLQHELGATRGFADLNRLVRLASMQQNIVLYLIYLGLQLLFLWDFRVLRLLEKWKARYSGHVADWFEALGRCEALISAATLADENPHWCFPEPCNDEEFILKTKRLGHPLLPDKLRVANDLLLSRSQPLLLVTGSNMAGKSTFIRSVGLNLLLARLGSPVCAQQLATPLFELASSMRVRDSLRDGVSFFMAELKRLKSVVDIARHHQNDMPPLLFLFDEILQGTNSRERQIAVAHVVQQLIRYGTTGILSTHDLELAQVDQVARVAQLAHFREHFEVDPSGKQVMRFDYVMRPGTTPTTNALKLLEMVGLKPDSLQEP